MNRSVVAPDACLSLTWGARFLLIEVALQELSPGQVVQARLVFGAVTLAVVSAARRQPLPGSPRVWAHLAVVSLLLCVCPFLLLARAERQLSSGPVSIYNATTR